jgi:hypothetical protein
MMYFCSIAVLVMLAELSSVSGHGYICDPPGRSSMWRKECGGFSTPTNVNDMGLNCGGLEVIYTTVQHFLASIFKLTKEKLLKVQFNGVNQGRCGECGDEWSLPRPRSNDEGGLYGAGIIGKTYKQGSVRIKYKFIFKICWLNKIKHVSDELLGYQYDRAVDSQPFRLLHIPPLPEDVRPRACDPRVFRSEFADVFRRIYEIPNSNARCVFLPEGSIAGGFDLQQLRSPVALHSR